MHQPTNGRHTIECAWDHVMGKRCAYLTMSNPGDYVTDYDLSYGAMSEQGWRVQPVAWLETSIKRSLTRVWP